MIKIYDKEGKERMRISQPGDDLKPKYWKPDPKINPKIGFRPSEYKDWKHILLNKKL